MRFNEIYFTNLIMIWTNKHTSLMRMSIYKGIFHCWQVVKKNWWDVLQFRKLKDPRSWDRDNLLQPLTWPTWRHGFFSADHRANGLQMSLGILQVQGLQGSSGVNMAMANPPMKPTFQANQTYHSSRSSRDFQSPCLMRMTPGNQSPNRQGRSIRIARLTAP